MVQIYTYRPINSNISNESIISSLNKRSHISNRFHRLINPANFFPPPSIPIPLSPREKHAFHVTKRRPVKSIRAYYPPTMIAERCSRTKEETRSRPKISSSPASVARANENQAPISRNENIPCSENDEPWN